MADEGRVSPPHGVLLLLVVGMLVAAPYLLGDGAAMTEAFADAISPTGLLLLPVALIFLIRFLSSDSGTALSSLFSAGSPDSIHRVGGSPVGVGLVLVLIVFLLYYRVSLFLGSGGGDDSGD